MAEQFLSDDEINQARKLAASCPEEWDVDASDAPDHIKVRAKACVRQRKIDLGMTGRAEPPTTF